jgi:pimeloyl-ACP methyl ester carboxylesterase
MEKYVESSDGVSIHYEIDGTGPVAIVFVHGWLGSTKWWINQKTFFEKRYTIVTLDLAGHGKSGRSRQNWTAAQYADDIKAVCNQIISDGIILVGHSMSGPYVLQASLNLPYVKALILIDTVKDPDQLFSYAQADEYILAPYRKDFKSAVETLLPEYLFSKTTPVHVREQLQTEFLKYDGIVAAQLIEPLYKTDVREVARLVKVPVRSINSDYTPTKSEDIRKYISDFDFVSVSGTGHYPMLEKPREFNLALDEILHRLIKSS